AAQFAEAVPRPTASARVMEVPTVGEQRRRAPARAVVPCALPVLATGAAAWGWLRAPATPPAPPVVRFSLAFQPGFQPLDSRGSTLALSPDGSRIVYVGSDSLGGTWLFSRGLEHLDPALIPGTQNARQPFFSPDGQWIGFWQDGRLRQPSNSGR